VEEALDIGWKLLSMLPVTSLKRVKPEEIEKWMPKTEATVVN
jgi:V/A-type H+-transporting ATPase subunit B